MRRKFLIFTLMIFILALGAVSADDSLMADENQDIISAPCAECDDILGEAQHARFSIDNSTSLWEISVLDDDDNYVCEGTVIYGFESSDSKSFSLSDYQNTVYVKMYDYFDYLPGNMTFSYSGENYNVSDLSVYAGELPDSIIAHDVIDESDFTATFLDGDGNLLTDGTAIFYVYDDGKDYYKAFYPKIDSNGVSGIGLALPVNNYTVKIFNPVTDQIKYCSWNVSREDESRYVTVRASQVGGRLIVSAVDVNGNNVTTGTFLFYDATHMKSEMLYENDFVSFSLYLFEFANYPQNISIFYEDYSQYYPNNTTVYVDNLLDSVLANDTVGKSFEATFLDDFGNPLGETEVTFYVAGDDGYWHDFHVLTDKNGVAVINPLFADGNYTVLSDNPFTYQRKENSLIIAKKNLTLEASANLITIGENATVVVNGFRNATGNASLMAGDGIYFADILNGTATFTVPGLIENTTAEIFYGGDDNYNNASTSVEITVNLRNASISAEPVSLDLIIGETGEIYPTTNPEYLDCTYASSDESVVTVESKHGIGIVVAVGEGNATITVSINEQVFVKNSTTVTVTVKKAPKENATIRVDAPAVTEGENATVTVTLPDDAKGNVTVDDEVVSLVNGTASAVLSGLPVGNTTVPVTYSGDDKYNPIETEVTVTVNEKPVVPKENLTISAAADAIYAGKDATVVVTGLKDATGNVTVTADDGIYSGPIIKGTASIVIPELYENTTAIVAYPGDDKYNNASTTVEITVNLRNASISVDPVSLELIIGETGEIYPTTNPEHLDCTYASSDESVATVESKHGIGRVVAVGEGNATITVSINEQAFVKNSTAVAVTVRKASNATVNIDAPDVDKYFKGPERFVATVTDKDNNPIANASVKITINGNDYIRVTDSSGIASMALNLNSGIYPVVTQYNGTKVNSSVIIKATISGEDVTKMFRNGTQYYATFVDTSGKTLANNTEVEFNINGVYYTRLTNENGVARMNINLNPGEYVITAQNPNSTEMHSNLITVLPSIVENRDLIKYYRNASQYTLRILDDEGNPVKAGVEVKLNINGVFYTRATNESGYVKMNINLNPGEYIITAEYNGLMASNNITVLSTIVTEDLLMKYLDGSKFNATIVDGEGNALANQNVTFNINGVLYDRTTDENGTAHLNINLMGGKYIITTTYGTLSISNRIIISEDKEDYFRTLQRKIDEANEGETVYLDNDVMRAIVYYPGEDSMVEDEISIDKSIIIDGQNHTINGCGDGRIFNIKSGNVVLKNIDFINGHVVYDNGAAILTSGDNVTVSGCHFKNNNVFYYGTTTVECRGGAICAYGNLTVINSVFEGNKVLDVDSAGCRGGAIYSNSSLTVRSSEFIDNVAESGSAIWAYAFLADIDDDCSFVNNGIVLVKLDPGMELLIDKTHLDTDRSVKITVNFNSNASGNVTVRINDKDERMLEIVNASASLTLSDLADGMYMIDAIYPENEYFYHASHTETFTVLAGESGTFAELQMLIDNASAGDAIYLEKDYVRGDDDDYLVEMNKSVSVIGNGHVIDAQGAKIFHISSDNVTLENITFTNAYFSFDGGGAVSIYGNNAVISACCFVNNGLPDWADLRGGALFISGNNALISDCYFKDNELSSYFGMKGGAVYCDSDLKVMNSVFEGNVISSTEYDGSGGGAIYCNGNLSVANSTFVSNLVSAYSSYGGAIYSTGTVNISDSSFIDNQLYGVYVDGGAVSAGGVNVANSVFKDNYILGSKSWDNPVTSSFGGAISSEAVYIYSSDFTNNSASSLDENQPSRGGAVYSSGVCNIEHACFTDNSADNGQSVWAYEAYSDVRNCTFINNNLALVKAYIEAPSLSKMYHGPEPFLAYLSENGKALANADVNININGKNYVRTTDEDGIASMAINLNSGEYNVIVTYEDASANSMIEIMSTVYGEDLAKIFGDATPYCATFWDTNGYLLNEGSEVEFNINGVLYKRYVDESGVAVLNINLNPGKYIITAKNPVSGEMHTNTVTILP